MKYDAWQNDREQAQDLGLMKVKTGETVGGKPYAILWKPKAIKPFANYSFRSVEHRDRYIKETLENLKGWKIIKDQRKRERKGTPEQLEKIKPGTIFIWSWGYEQTNLNFYQVIERKGRFVYIREIAQDAVKGSTYPHGMAEMRIGLKDHFLEDSQPIKKLVQFTGDGEPYLTLDTFGWCGLWNGEARYCSWYG